MAEILTCFRPGRNSWLAPILGRRIDKILFAATKADYLHHEQHPKLTAITEALVADVGVAPDVVIADYLLDGDENGLDAIARMRARNGNVPAVIVSADRSTELRARAAQANVTLLHKPLELHRLQAVLQWVKNAAAQKRG
mgnify:CR=1 FL=1